jgi:hypothetical protein
MGLLSTAVFFVGRRDSAETVNACQPSLDGLLISLRLRSLTRIRNGRILSSAAPLVVFETRLGPDNADQLGCTGKEPPQGVAGSALC